LLPAATTTPPHTRKRKAKDEGIVASSKSTVTTAQETNTSPPYKKGKTASAASPSDVVARNTPDSIPAPKMSDSEDDFMSGMSDEGFESLDEGTD
jgi:hypothetical protein